MGLPTQSGFIEFKKNQIINVNNNISTIPLVNKTLKSVMKLGKDSTNKWKETNIVYKFNCENCPAIYIGKSKRAFRVRINEHKN